MIAASARNRTPQGVRLLIPPLSARWTSQSRAVPFGPRKILGCVTRSGRIPHTNLKPIIKYRRTNAVTPKVLKLARWIADYYCCAGNCAQERLAE